MDRNRGMARRLARVLVGAGLAAEALEPGEPLPAADGLLVVAEAEAQEALRPALQRPRGAAVLYGPGGAAELDAAALLAEPGLLAILAQRPGHLEAELLALARHLRGAPLPPLQGLLAWGAQAYAAEIADLGGREAAVARVVALCADELGAARRVADSAGEVVHELITNAMYDAPVDGSGAPRYARDRTAPIELPGAEQVLFRFGTDGVRVAVEAEDRFGRLRRADLLGSLRRGAAGQVSREEGGAGIGLSRVLRASQTVLFDVVPGQRTRVLALLDLEPARAAEGAPRPGSSLLFPAREGDRGGPEP